MSAKQKLKSAGGEIRTTSCGKTNSLVCFVRIRSLMNLKNHLAENATATSTSQSESLQRVKEQRHFGRGRPLSAEMASTTIQRRLRRTRTRKRFRFRHRRFPRHRISLRRRAQGPRRGSGGGFWGRVNVDAKRPEKVDRGRVERVCRRVVGRRLEETQTRRFAH